MISIQLDLIILSEVVAIGIAFLLWVFFHLIQESRQTRNRSLPLSLNRSDRGLKGNRAISMLVFAVICWVVQA